MIKKTFENCKSNTLRYLTISFIFLCVASVALAQDAPKVSINKILSSVNAFTNNLAVEKLYLQTDKSYYVTGDTLWFKGYLFDASYLNASTKSGVLYVEIANDSNTVLKRIMLPVLDGLIYGYIALNQKEIPLQGGYILRAYTNWMRNFGEDYIFKKHFYIRNATDEDWLINYNTGIVNDDDKEKIQLGLKFTRFNKAPIGLREMQIRISDGRRTWFKSDVKTSIDGLLDVNFVFPEKATSRHLMLTVQDMSKDRSSPKLLVPLLLNRPEQIDLQFLPEGGYLVENLPAHIAFKAINEDGLGVNVSGKVYNSKSQEVAEFGSTYKGIGTFDLIPRAGETYLAKIRLPDGSYKAYTLPVVKKSGTVLKINNQSQSDSCEIIISATTDVAAGDTYFLIGQARGVACYGASFNFNKGAVKLMVSKKTFPSGIVRFTLAVPDKNALNERIIFIDHADDLRIQLIGNKTSYQQRDSVALIIKVSDKNDMAVQGNFSIAVTDDSQVATDSTRDGSIITQMLIAGDLKGNIEDPGYYFQSATNAKKWQDLDNLLLTQGWVGYDWNEVFEPVKVFTYTAEQEFLIKGRVTNMFNKPVVNSGVTLLSKKPFFVMDTLTNNQGAFTFEGVVPGDTAVFFIQSKNKRGKSFNVGIEMNEFEPPVSTADNERTTPWYVNIDTGRLLRVNKQIQLKKDQEQATGGIVLKEVIVEGKRIIKDSKNLNGPGEADIIVGEEELEKAGRTSLGDLLYKKIKGFGVIANKYGQRFYRINGLMVHLIIDGMDTEFFQPESVSLYEYFKQYFDYYDAEEIKGIEVMTSTRYESSYRSSFLHPLAEPWAHAFIEVTTRGGKGPFVKKSVGTYLYKPMPFTLPKKFYSPKYNAGSTVDLTDIRSTIYWNPDIVTGKDGKATVVFYTADIPGSYSLIIEGSDMKGNLGVKRAKIMIKRSQ